MKFHENYNATSIVMTTVHEKIQVTFPLKLDSKGLWSIRGVFGPMSKISFTLSNYSFVIWDKNYRRCFVI